MTYGPARTHAAACICMKYEICTHARSRTFAHRSAHVRMPILARVRERCTHWRPQRRLKE
eukprot:1374953-Pleurochrysis_carterae.AAC.1